ncbi:hypothetical protein PAESOLCIP111_05116 [Paenibacillus solanacearum]|uniref:Peptidase S74 domain-containing protein n=1 Tax=Paenibacillus solanacearum TaxID=2048548 RepID=A0A916K5Y2_9BACL|nr:tail fiber domain-containing protein [Paenibacillus solanacearum]CAG7646220.1 hypothetical protein PAESOLCIP111_05116 [Paenibacillus solanacearum]
MDKGRRELIKSLGATGVLAVSAGLIPVLSTTEAAGNSPHDKIGELSDLKTKDKSSLVSSVNETCDNMDGRGINIKYPPAPLVGAKVDGVTDDTLAIRAILAYAEQMNANLFIPGISVITGEVEIKKTMVVQGIGPGRGYTSAGIKDYVQRSGFLVKGVGVKRIRTRRLHRSSAAEPQDAALSVAINVQAENVVFKDFCVFLDFDRQNNSPNHYGADWDVGIFVGCRTHFKLENIHVMGYWREASYYYDVTHATNLQRFQDLNGNPYDNTFNVSGGDGCTMFKCMAWGGKWGIFVAGAIKSATNPNYYDGLSGAVVPDYRGSFGFSDFTTYSCSIYGTDHHSLYRRNKATGDYLNDQAGGAMYVDGAAANATDAVWGHRHVSTRFASFEPYRVRLDRAARVQFYGCHIEYRSGSNRKNQDGTAVLFENTDTYGFISGTANTDHVVLVGYPGGVIEPAFMPASVRIHNLFPSGTTKGSSTTDSLTAKGFYATSGELDLRSAGAADPIRFRFGSESKVQLNSSGLLLMSSYTNPSISAGTGELDLRSANGSPLRFRQGSSSFAMFDAASWRAATDNTTSLGSSGARFTQLYAATGTINTSDRNAKQQIKPIDDIVLDAWSEVNYSRFKFNDAVDEKGDKARTHFGIIAQGIEEAFARHGLNAFEYGILGYDKWDAIEEEEEVAEAVVDKETGETCTTYRKTGRKKRIREAGGMYSIRPDECLMLEAALMRRELRRLKGDSVKA